MPSTPAPGDAAADAARNDNPNAAPDANSATLSCRLPDEAATAKLARALAPALVAGLRIHLSGELGSGKTTFVRALLRTLGYPGRARSPTFTLLEPYPLSSFDLYHFDFYRLSSDSAWLDAGFDEYLDGRGVVVIEWPEMAGDTLPPADLDLRIGFDPAEGPGARRIHALARGARGLACLKAMRAAGCCEPAPGPVSAQR